MLSTRYVKFYFKNIFLTQFVLKSRRLYNMEVLKMATFGDRLRSLRKNKTSLTMKELGKLIGVSESAVGMYERGEREPDFETTDKIASYFNVTTDYLLGRSDIKNPEEITYAGIKNDEYAALTPYQKEVMDFFMQSESLSFHDKPENLLDALEEFEIFYEMLKKREERKK